MKKVILLIVILSVSVTSLIAQTENNSNTQKRKIQIGWNSTLGISAGYSKMFQPFNSEYYGINAPVDLINITEGKTIDAIRKE